MRWKQNHGTEQPSIIGFFDTEAFSTDSADVTQLRSLSFRLGVLRIGRWNGASFDAVQTVRFNRPHQFWRAVTECGVGKKVAWLYAHNIMFDLTLLGWQEKVEKGEIKLSLHPAPRTQKGQVQGSTTRGWRGQVSIDPGCTLIKCLIGGKRVNFCDTFNYFRSSVEEVGRHVGTEKIALPSDDDGNDVWFTRCARDVEIIERATTGLMRTWRSSCLGNWQPTIASLAYSSYRHGFMNRVVVSHEHKETSEYESSAYYDGRVSAFYCGRIPASGSGSCNLGRETIRPAETLPSSPVYHVDVNSLYPSVMRGNRYPVECICDSDGVPVTWRPPNVEWLLERIEDYCCVATVKIETDQPVYPYRHKGEVVYPVGSFWTTLCTPEILMANEMGNLRGISSAVLYVGWPIFNRWVDYWWQRKSYCDAKGDSIGREMAKLMMNSLAGKLGQRNRYWVNTNRWPAEDAWVSWPTIQPETGHPINLRSIGYQTQMQVADGWAPHALVASAAHVNSYARVRMVCDINSLPEKSVLYQSNDGLLLTDSGYLHLANILGLVGNDLGQYRLCGVYEDAEIFGPRDYRLGTDLRKAGLPRDRAEISERRWSVRRFESALALVCRPPDGTVRVYDDVVSGSPLTPGQYRENSGWMKPIRLTES